MNANRSALEQLKIERKPESPRRSKGWLLVFCILALVAATAAVAWMRPRVPEVKTVQVKAMVGSGATEATVLNASGYVTARRKATISAKITGKIVEVLVEEGLTVKSNQVLARLDDSNVRRALAVAQASLESARLNLDETRALLKQADREYTRTTELAKARIASQSDLDKAESDAVSLRARLVRQEGDVRVAEKQVATAEQDIDDTIVRAPFSGVITTKDAQPGEMISPVSAGGGFTRTGVCTVVDMESLEIEIDVNESYINRVKQDQPAEATLDSYPSWKIPCKVIAIIPTADRQKSTVKVRVGFDQLDPRILPEMGVKVAFHETKASGAAAVRATLVPKGAIRQEGGRDVVLVVQNGVVERRAVTVAGSEGEDVVVNAGLASGERVVVDGPEGLQDRAAVREKRP